jgi:hypothetical protein
MKKLLLSTLIFLFACVVGIYFFNYATLTKPVFNSISSDDRNQGIDFSVHYRNFISTNTLVFDLKKVPTDKTIADVFRVLLQTSAALKDRKFETVELSFQRKPKFTLKGEYFNQLGRHFDVQNPVYTMRTFPENVLDLKGQNVYSERMGGVLGVLTKQVEDFKDFHEKWYIADMK